MKENGPTVGYVNPYFNAGQRRVVIVTNANAAFVTACMAASHEMEGDYALYVATRPANQIRTLPRTEGQYSLVERPRTLPCGVD